MLDVDKLQADLDQRYQDALKQGRREGRVWIAVCIAAAIVGASFGTYVAGKEDREAVREDSIASETQADTRVASEKERRDDRFFWLTVGAALGFGASAVLGNDVMGK